MEKNNELREQVTQLTHDTMPAFSSTHREVLEPSNDSLILSTISGWSLGTLNVPECISSTSGEIDKKAFENWKDMFTAALQLTNSAADEETKFSWFKIKAGSKLIELFDATSSTPSMPNEDTSPFSNAMARLNAHFGSRSYLLAQRGQLMNLSQLSSESSVQFVRRVYSATKLCGYNQDEEMETLVRVLTKGASDSRVRVLARRNWVKEGSISDLIDLIREREIEKSNEEEFLKSHAKSETALVAAVSSNSMSAIQQNQSRYRPYHWENHQGFGGQQGFRGHRGFRGQRGFGGQRGFAAQRGFGSQRGYGGYWGFYQGNGGTTNQAKAAKCWRCDSVFHLPENCPNISKQCYVCNQIGHVAR